MRSLAMEECPDGLARAQFGKHEWERQWFYGERGPFYRWRCVSSDRSSWSATKFHKLLESRWDSGDYDEIQRFPRLGITKDSAVLANLPTITEVKCQTARWLIEGMFLQNSINLLTGPPGGFKTWLALWIGQCVAKGCECLGQKTVKTRVLYLDRENPPAVIHKRRKLLRLDSDRFHIWANWWEYDTPAIGDSRLLDIAERDSPLIIFDSFVRFHDADENSAKQMARVLKHLRKLANAGATILLLHHQAKSQASQYRGSTDILAGVDAAFELQRVKQKHSDIILNLRCFKHRQVEETTATIRLNLEERKFDLVPDASDVIPSDLIRRIQTVITKHPSITQKSLMRKAQLPETNGRKFLRRGDGNHWRSKRGDGSALHYYLKS